MPVRVALQDEGAIRVTQEGSLTRFVALTVSVAAKRDGAEVQPDAPGCWMRSPRQAPQTTVVIAPGGCARSVARRLSPYRKVSASDAAPREIRMASGAGPTEKASLTTTDSPS